MGQQYGLSRFDPATNGFTNYRPDPGNPASLNNWIWAIDQDRSGTLWLGTFGGALIRFDDKTQTFITYSPNPRDPQKLNGGGITTIHANGALETFDRIATLIKNSKVGGTLDFGIIKHVLRTTIDIVLYLRKRQVEQIFYDPLFKRVSLI